jgi:hypothetical protein
MELSSGGISRHCIFENPRGRLGYIYIYIWRYIHVGIVYLWSLEREREKREQFTIQPYAKTNPCIYIYIYASCVFHDLKSL